MITDMFVYMIWLEIGCLDYHVVIIRLVNTKDKRFSITMMVPIIFDRKQLKGQWKLRIDKPRFKEFKTWDVDS